MRRHETLLFALLLLTHTKAFSPSAPLARDCRGHQFTYQNKLKAVHLSDITTISHQGIDWNHAISIYQSILTPVMDKFHQLALNTAEHSHTSTHASASSYHNIDWKHPKLASQSILAPLMDKSHHILFDIAHNGHPSAQHLAKHHESLTHGSATSRLLHSYSDLLKEKPLSTKGITASILAISGDAIAQKTSASTQNADSGHLYDIKRGAAFAVFGTLYTGMFQHYWFEWLNNNLSGTISSIFPALTLSPSLLAAAKLSVNQFLTVPLIYMPLFFSVTSAMMGLSHEESVDRAKELYAKILKRNWMFWLPVQFVQFSFIDPEWQVLYACAAGLAWTTILSLSSAGESASIDADEEDQLVFENEIVPDISPSTITLANVQKGTYVGIMSKGFVW